MTANDEDKNGHEKDILGQIGVVEEDVERFIWDLLMQRTAGMREGDELGREPWIE